MPRKPGHKTKKKTPIISHNRFFIDKVATRPLVFEGEGVVSEVAGDRTIWQARLDSAD